MWSVTPLFITPICSGIIGYVTNKLAIKMLFRPRKKFLGLQGLLIKRKTDLAKSLSKTIVERFLDKDFETALPEGEIEKHIKNFLTGALSEFMSRNGLDVPDDFKSDLCDALLAEILSRIDLSSMPKSCKSELIDKVCQNILNIPDQEIEDLVISIAETEFFAIEIIGAILGFVIGLGNALIIYYGG